MSAHARHRYLDWPFFDDAPPRAGAARSTPGPRDHCRRSATATTSTPHCRAAGARAGRRRLAAPRGRRQRATAARPTRSTRAPSACCARRWRATTAWPTSPSRCRAWARGAITLDGSAEQKARYLPRVARGEAIAAFALSEPDAGSDVAAMACTARARRRRTAVLDGEKTWISNGGIADFYVVFARTGEAPGARGISRLRRRRRHAGLRDRRAHRRDRAASAGARCASTDCRIPASQRARRRRARASSSRCARSTSSAPRWPRPRSASRAARWTRPGARHARADVRRARWPTSS